MSLEIEKKYLNPDFQTVRERLVDAQATYCATHFEENWLFDTPDRRLRSANILLRLRRADGGTLTVKKKPDASTPFDGRFKVLEEMETAVLDLESMRMILEMLGYVIVFQYEKIRETWQWHACTVCLDTLPFAQFVELEGTSESIELTARRLDLDKLESSTGNYPRIYADHCRSLGISGQDGLLFTSAQRAAARAAPWKTGREPIPYAEFLRPGCPGA